MHPILGHRRRLGLYLGAWLPAGLLLAMLAVLSADPGEGLGWSLAVALAVPLAVVFGLLNLSSWYLCRSLPLAGGEGPVGLLRLASAHLVAAGLSTGMWLLLGYGWAHLLADLPGPGKGLPVDAIFRAQTPIYLAAGVLLYLLAAVVHYLLIAFEASRIAEARTLELRVLAREAELRALRAQIDPHFLFNSLHSISARIGSDPQAAREMCIGLADFFRRSLKAGGQEGIPLQEELALAEMYLAIEEARYGERLRFRREVDREALATTVPPLLLQPLIENAVRHGIAHLLEGGEIHLKVELRPAEVVVTVQNPRDPEAPSRRGAGIGQNNVRGRLERRYGPRASLTTEATAEGYRAELRIPLEGEMA